VIEARGAAAGRHTQPHARVWAARLPSKDIGVVQGRQGASRHSDRGLSWRCCVQLGGEGGVAAAKDGGLWRTGRRTWRRKS
jgi:transposase